MKSTNIKKIWSPMEDQTIERRFIKQVCERALRTYMLTDPVYASYIDMSDETLILQGAIADEIRELVLSGRKIDAIRVYRNYTGSDLLTAKQDVEYMLANVKYESLELMNVFGHEKEDNRFYLLVSIKRRNEDKTQYQIFQYYTNTCSIKPYGSLYDSSVKATVSIYDIL